jgi:hypothetical protein
VSAEVEKALRGRLAECLANATEPRVVFGRIAVRSGGATWTLSEDGRTLLAYGGPKICPAPDGTRGTEDLDAHDVPDITQRRNGEQRPDLSRVPPGPDLIDHLERLSALRERDMLSEREFTAAKALLLSQGEEPDR